MNEEIVVYKKRDDLVGLYEQLNIPELGRSVIEYIRNGEPVRKVDGGGFSVCGDYKSRVKLHLSIQFDSKHVEYAYVIYCEFNNKVIEYYDQPYRIKITYTLESGRNTTHHHVPDYLVITKDEIYFVECKEESKLFESHKKHPEKFTKNIDGSWSCPPAEEATQQWGIGYKVVSSAQLSSTFTRNCAWLSDYYLKEKPENYNHIKQTINSFFSQKKFSTLDKLLKIHIDKDDIYWALVNGFFYMDLENQLLAAPEVAKIYANQTYSEAFIATATSIDKHSIHIKKINLNPGSTISWDKISWKILNSGKTDVSLEDKSGNLISLKLSTLEELVLKGKITGCELISNTPNYTPILNSTLDELEIANERYEIIYNHIFSSNIYKNKPVKNKTHRDWITRYKNSSRIYGFGYLGLIPNIKSRGNRTTRLLPEVLKALYTIIEDNYIKEASPRRKTIHEDLKAVCNNKGWPVCSYETICKHIKKYNLIKMTEGKQGKKAAYQQQGPMPKTDLNLPPDGDRAFEVGHIDHTLTGVKVISAITGEVIGQLWLTVLIDAFSNLILSHYLTFDPPSYRSSMMVVRECVKKYGRIPNIIVVDRGSDFRSIYFDSLINALCFVKFLRPTAQPRYGGSVERIFGTIDTHFFDMLSGNTINYSLGRGLSASHNPLKKAIWTADILNEELSNWIYNVHPNLKNTGIGETPNNRFNRSISQSGHRKHSLFPYDQNLIILTMPAPKRAPRIRSNEGVRVNYFSYWHPILGRTDLSGKVVEVRYEPFDPSFVFVLIDNKWLRCLCRHKIIREFTERDIKMAFEEVKHIRYLAKKDYRITPNILVEYLVRIRARNTELEKAKKSLQKQFSNPVIDQQINDYITKPEVENILKLPTLPVTKLQKNKDI